MMTVNVTWEEDEDNEFDRGLLLEADIVIVVLDITNTEGPEDIDLEGEMGV